MFHPPVNTTPGGRTQEKSNDATNALIPKIETPLIRNKNSSLRAATRRRGNPGAVDKNLATTSFHPKKHQPDCPTQRRLCEPLLGGVAIHITRRTPRIAALAIGVGGITA